MGNKAPHPALAMLHTENVARRGNLSFQNVGGGGEGVYDVLTFQKSRRARVQQGGAKVADVEYHCVQ